jgi:hypothetical protein
LERHCLYHSQVIFFCDFVLVISPRDKVMTVHIVVWLILFYLCTLRLLLIGKCVKQFKTFPFAVFRCVCHLLVDDGLCFPILNSISLGSRLLRLTFVQMEYTSSNCKNLTRSKTKLITTFCPRFGDFIRLYLPNSFGSRCFTLFNNTLLSSFLPKPKWSLPSFVTFT